MNNIPRPRVALVDGHSYVSLRYVIIDFLGKGKHPTKMEFGNKDYIDKIANLKLGREAIVQRVLTMMYH